jgi:hypothetical protein
MALIAARQVSSSATLFRFKHFAESGCTCGNERNTAVFGILLKKRAPVHERRGPVAAVLVGADGQGDSVNTIRPARSVRTQAAHAALVNELTSASEKARVGQRRHTMSPAGGSRIAAAQRARWIKRRQRESKQRSSRARKQGASKTNARQSVKMKAYWAKKKASRK